jgi:hypothetical protein
MLFYKNIRVYNAKIDLPIMEMIMSDGFVSPTAFLQVFYIHLPTISLIYVDMSSDLLMSGVKPSLSDVI